MPVFTGTRFMKNLLSIEQLSRAEIDEILADTAWMKAHRSGVQRASPRPPKSRLG